MLVVAIGATGVLVAANRGIGLTREPSRLGASGLLDDGRPGHPGELVITGMRGTMPDEALLRRIRSGEVAGVLLMGANIRSRAQVSKLTSTLQAAAATNGSGLPLLIAVDQEGGAVRRFTWLPPVASARTMANWSNTRIRRTGRAAGAALRSVGVNVDLAPVADVPTTATNFLGSRAFSRNRTRVAVAACAFSRGLRDGGVLSALKHFPGLGAAGTSNTDLAVTRIRRSTALLQRDTGAYRRCGAEAGTLAMMSNAIYPPLTGAAPAVLSPATYALARTVGEPGPFITDSLNARGLAGQRAVAARAVNAGSSLLLYVSPASAAAGYRDLVSAVTRGTIAESTLTARAVQVRQLRRLIRASGP